MTLAILGLENEDLDDLMVLENELFSHPWKKEDYEYELNNNPFANYLKLIIKETNELIGYLGFWIKFEQAEITKVGIAKKYQGYKLSKLLMADCLKRMKEANCESVTLEVRVSNVAAIHLYESFNFKTLTVRHKYYDNGEDAYLMMKELV